MTKLRPAAGRHQLVNAGTRVVQYDRRKQEIVDRDGVVAKFGVPPESIADFLALVGDSVSVPVFNLCVA